MGRDALGKALDGIDERMAVRQPGPGRWSVLECVEHLAIAEQLLLSRLTSAVRSDGSHPNPAREAKILERGLDRTTSVQASEAGRPHGRFRNLDEALSFFDSVRTETVRFVEGFSGDPRCWLTSHPLIPGPVNCYEILLLMSIHPVRHARQIGEIRAALAGAPGFAA